MPDTLADFPAGPVAPGEETAVLMEFVTSVEEFLRYLIEGAADGGDFEQLFDVDLVLRVLDALAASPPFFSDLRAAIDRASREDLDAHGLVGPMLDAKLAVAAHLARRVRAALEWLAEGVREDLSAIVAGRMLPLLEKFLDLIDSMLKSIVKAVGAADAVEEFKDLVKAALWVAEPFESDRSSESRNFDL